MDLKDFIQTSHVALDPISEKEVAAIEAAGSLVQKIIAVFKSIRDPELPLDIWELGLIYRCYYRSEESSSAKQPTSATWVELDMRGGGMVNASKSGEYDEVIVPTVASDNSTIELKVMMTLTTPACPVAGALPKLVKERLESFICTRAAVELTWEPAWNMEMVSEEGKLIISML